MKIIVTYCTFLLTLSVNAWAEELYLQGVSVIGERKTAYIAKITEQMEEVRITVVEGDSLGQWLVARITPKFVILESEQGEEKQLHLHSALPVEENLSQEDTANSPQFTRPVIPDQDIPPGYKKIQTPFGDFLVRKKEEPSATIVEPTATNSMSGMSEPMNGGHFASVEKKLDDGESPSSPSKGYRKVKTPFGEFILKKTR